MTRSIFTKTLSTIAVMMLYAMLCGAQAPKDTVRVLCLGNSFTYVADSHLKFAQIADSQGHPVRMKALYVGGYTFNDHLTDIKSVKAVENLKEPYFAIFLQDQSQALPRYASDPRRFRYIKSDAVELALRARMYCPDARIFLEQTWSYPAIDCGGFGTLDEFDRLATKGAKAISKASGTMVSPIGQAFVLAREICPEIDLLGKDRKHQSAYGSYLKACVNYLIAFGEKFSGKVSDCGLDPQKTAELRKVAEMTVLK